MSNILGIEETGSINLHTFHNFPHITVRHFPEDNYVSAWAIITFSNPNQEITVFMNEDQARKIKDQLNAQLPDSKEDQYGDR